MKRALLPIVVTVLAVATSLAQGTTQGSETIDGVRNFVKIDGSAACAGATEPRAMAAIAAHGYRTVVNLRLETENGARIDESRAAAEAAGMTFVHLPLSPSAPEPAVADAFLKVASDPTRQPIYIHCASGQRAAALWLTKRLLVDKWPKEKALAEAHAAGLTSASLEQFALDYVASKGK